MWQHSTVPLVTASAACRPGTSSPDGEHLDLEPVVGHLGDGLGEHLGGAVDRVERFREARGEPPLELGLDCAMAGFGQGRGRDRPAAAAAAYRRRTSRRTSMISCLPACSRCLQTACAQRHLVVCGAYAAHICHATAHGHAPAPRRTRQCSARQPLARVRIMKLSKLYSVTCHHRYWSPRNAAMAVVDLLEVGVLGAVSA